MRHQHTGFLLVENLLCTHKEGMDHALVHGDRLGRSALQIGIDSVIESEQQVAVAHEEEALLAIAGGIICQPGLTIATGRDAEIGAISGMKDGVTANK